jgi:Na+-translocating ferredoxin:NAD+ oxidoreductase RnfC subunit
MNAFLKQIEEAGIIGAGGAGFPTHKKFNPKAEYLIINAAECEPLLAVDKRLSEKYANELIIILTDILEVCQLKKAFIGIKKKNKKAIQALEDNLNGSKAIEIKALENVYPIGDEVVLTYEILGKIISKGAIPIEHKAIVINLETLFNIYRMKYANAVVTHSYVTVAGEVKLPATYRVPIGTSVTNLIQLTGGAKIDDYEVVIGGPMTGRLANSNDVINKTTKAIILLDKDHTLVHRLQPIKMDSIIKTMGVCSQCRACTDLCPRNLLGQVVEPHKLMNAIANGITNNTHMLTTALGCVDCGVCEMYACHHDLSPRKLMSQTKRQFIQSGVRPMGEKIDKPLTERENLKIPSNRLVMRLGLKPYDIEIPLNEMGLQANEVKIKCNQHIGTPLNIIAKIGDKVEVGQMIAQTNGDGLGSYLHASIKGKVTEITEAYIKIERTY